jgi:MFS family permease
MAFWASGAPSIVYPLYAARWHLTPLITTEIFAIYPLVLVIMLILFGNVSDYIGRRSTLLIGLAFLLIGTILFALAPGIGLIFPGRILQGIGVGLAVGAGSAALVDYNPYGPRVPGPASTAVQSVGFTLALVVGAILVQFAPDPLHLPYWVLVAAFVICGLFTLALPRHNPVDAEARGKWKPQGLLVPRGLGRPYVLASIALAVSYATGAAFLSLGADIEHAVLKGASVLESGLALSLTTILIGVGAWIASRIGSKIAVRVGVVIVVLSSGALVGSALTSSLVLFLVSCALGGIAGGLLAAGGVSTAIAAAPARHRAQMLSAVFLVGYVAQGGIALAGGAIATSVGLAVASIWIAIILTAIATLALVLSVTLGAWSKPKAKSESLVDVRR